MFFSDGQGIRLFFDPEALLLSKPKPITGPKQVQFVTSQFLEDPL